MMKMYICKYLRRILSCQSAVAFLVFLLMISGTDAQIRISDSIPQYLFSDFATGVVVKKRGENNCFPELQCHNGGDDLSGEGPVPGTVGN